MRAHCAALALAAQREPLLDSEPVLLVDDDEPEVRKRHPGLEQRMRSHCDGGLAAGDAAERPPALAAREPPGEPDHSNPERIEPVAEAREVLLGEKLGGRHQGNLAFVGHRHHRCERRDHRLAGAHVALHQPVHRSIAREIGPDLLRHPALGGGQPERQRVGEPAHQRIAAVQRRGMPAVDPAAQHAQREVVCQQLLEREAPPGRMLVVQRRLGVRARRRPVDRPQCVDEADETVAHGHRFGQQIGDVGIALEPVEGLVDQAPQQRLTEPRRGGIHRGQTVCGRKLRVVVEEPVLRVHHLHAAGRGTHLPVAGDALARPELPALVLVEVEQPHRHRPGAVADGDDEGASAPETHAGALDPAAGEGGVSRARVSDRTDAGPILVSRGEMEQQVEHRLDPERREPRGDARSDAAKLGHRHRFEGRCTGGLDRAGGRGGLHGSSAPRLGRATGSIDRLVARHIPQLPVAAQAGWFLRARTVAHCRIGVGAKRERAMRRYPNRGRWSTD